MGDYQLRFEALVGRPEGYSIWVFLMVSELCKHFCWHKQEVHFLVHLTHHFCCVLWEALGLQVRLSAGKADVVFLYNEQVDGFSRFEGTLPEAWSFARGWEEMLGQSMESVEYR